MELKIVLERVSFFISIFAMEKFGLVGLYVKKRMIVRISIAIIMKNVAKKFLLQFDIVIRKRRVCEGWREGGRERGREVKRTSVFSIYIYINNWFTNE
jgi:hypothetical protein